MFHEDWTRNMAFLLVANFQKCLVFSSSDFIYISISTFTTIRLSGKRCLKNPFFMTYMYNMRIKWKLKIYQIQIRNRSCNLKENFGWKMNFQKLVLISTRFFSKSKFFKVFQIQPPKIFFYLFQTPKKLDPGRFGLRSYDKSW